MSKFFVLLLLTIGSNVACIAGDAISNRDGFKFFDGHTQMIFIEALKNEGISYEVGADGTVLYRPRDEREVNRIRNKILNELFVPSVHYEDKAYEQNFIDRLTSEGIDFGVEVKEGKRWITWSKADNQKVEIILQSE